MRAFPVLPPVRSTAGIASGGGGWSPLEISADARVYLAEGATGSGSEIVTKWYTRRDNRNWGDWIPRDGAMHWKFSDSDRIYMMGGWSQATIPEYNNYSITNEAWYSDDYGVSWVRWQEDDPSPSGRPPKLLGEGGTCVMTIDGQEYFYLVGGQVNSSTYIPENNQVWRWSREDGWELISNNPEFSDRNTPSLGVLNGVMYLFGGTSGVFGDIDASATTTLKDMWKSEDYGYTWSLVTSDCPWGKRLAMSNTLPTLNGKLWLIGGLYAITGFGIYDARNDVQTFDGTNFAVVLADGHVQWPPRYLHNTAVYDGQLYAIKGHAEDGLNLPNSLSVVRSSDGVTWEDISADCPMDDLHAMSIWSTSLGLVMAHGYVTTTGVDYIFSHAVYMLANVTGTRVASWGDATASGGNRPYLVDGYLSTGKKTVYFNGSNFLELASKATFSGNGSFLIAGFFPSFHATNLQTIIGSDDAIQLGLKNSGVFVKDSSGDNPMTRTTPNLIQREKIRTIAFTQASDGAARMWIDKFEVDVSGEDFEFTGSGWSKIGAGYSDGDGLVGHITAVAVIPDATITQSDVDSFVSYARSKSGIAEEASLLSSIVPDQLLLRPYRPAFETGAGSVHLLKDYSTDFRGGVPIPGFAPQFCFTGGDDSAYLTFGAYRPGMDTDGNIEVEFSFRTPASVTRTETILANHSDGDNSGSWKLNLQTNFKLGWHQQHNGSVTLETTILSPSTWYRVKFVRSGSTGNWDVSAYINGVQNATVNTAVNPGGFYASNITRMFNGGGGPYMIDDAQISDIWFRHDGHTWRIPLCEGAGLVLHAIRMDGILASQNVIGIGVACWAGPKTEPASQVQNWFLANGGSVSDATNARIPCFNNDSPNTDYPMAHFPGRWSIDSLLMDPSAVSAGSVGLEADLTLAEAATRNADSSGKRRVRNMKQFTRLGAKSTAMNSSDANDYFGD